MNHAMNSSFRLLISLVLGLCMINSMHTAVTSNVSATTTMFNDHDPIHIFAALKFPAAQVTDQFTLQIFQNIDATFGASGLQLDPLQIAHIKNCYLYLIFLTKVEKVKNDAAYQMYQTDFTEFLQDNQQRTPHLPTTKLVQSQGWSNVAITSQDIVASNLWQLFCKSMICDIYVYFATGLQIIHNVEKQEFNYVPHFETSYYNKDYTDLRTINAVVRTKILLEHQLKQRYLAQCPSWKGLPAQTDSSASSNLTLEKAVVQFRKTEFYQATHDIHMLLGTRQMVNSGQPITHQQLMSAPQLATPLKEYVFGYYMLYEMYGQITSHMTDDNLEQTLTIVSQSGLEPNIFPYTLADFVFLDELLAAKSKAEGTNIHSIHPTPSTFKPEDFRNPQDMLNPTRKPTTQYLAEKTGLKPSVQAQGFFSFFRHIGDDIAHDVKKGFDAVKNGAEAAWSATKNTVEAVGEGIAGVGCQMIFWDKSIVDEGKHLTKESQHEFDAAGKSLQTSIDQFADSIKDGIVAPIGEVTGDLVGFITQDKKIGASISEVIDSTADAIVQLSVQMTANQTIGAAIYGMQDAFDAASVAVDVTKLIVSGTEVIFTDGKDGNDAFSHAWHSTLNDSLTLITAAYTQGLQIGKTMVADVMRAMGAVMSSLTTLFIDLSREITFLFTMVGTALLDSVAGTSYNPLQVAEHAANHVNNVLNAHRQVINMTLGVVVCVAADVATDVASGGAATAADAEMDAMIMGAAESGGEASAEAAESAATAAQDAVSSAQDAVDEAAENLTNATADGDEAAMQAAKETLEQAKSALETAEKAAQDAAENAVKSQARREALSNVAKSLSNEAKSWGAKALRVGKEKLENALESLKSLPKNAAKSLANLAKSNAKIAEEAAQNARTAEQAVSKAKQALQDARQAYLDSVGPGGEVNPDAAADLLKAADELKKVKSAAQDAERFAKLAQKIADESKAGKALRFIKNGFKAFKPLGMAMNVAFNFTMMISGYNQDEQNLLTQSQQSQELKDLWQANTQTKLSVALSDMAYLDELSQKQSASAENQLLNLALYQNYSYSFIDQYQQLIINALAPIYLMQLVPDPKTGLVQGNTGTQWGLGSNYLDLYPAQSFYTTTTGRNDFPFAQEIAQAPRLLNPTSTHSKEWFNQRCIAIDAVHANNTFKKPEDPLSVRIDLQFLYTLESEFYVGLYMGGDYNDYFSTNYVARLLNTTPGNIQSAFTNLQQLLNQTPQPSTSQYLNPNVIDLNEPYLAKMLVLYRNSANDTLKIGVYEHMGTQEWLLEQALPPSAQLSDNTTYSLQATLSGNELTIALYVNDNTTPIVQKTITVTPIANQRMYGVISSGAAIQWNQITPKAIMSRNSTVRPATTQPSETKRGQTMKAEMADAQSPTFGDITLTPLSKQAILFGQYVYASTKTDLKRLDPKNPADFLVFATNTSGTISNIGKIPNSVTDKNTNVLVSLITGHVFSPQGDILKVIPNVWNIYQSSEFGPFSANLNTYIVAQQKNVRKALSKITFGSFILNIINQASLSAGAYIYTCAQTLQTAAGKPFVDYLIFTQAPANSSTALQLGLSPTSANTGALLSLITGNLYLKDTQLSPNTPPKALYTYDVFHEFSKYAQEGNIQLADYNTIKAAQAEYLVQQQSTGSPQTLSIAAAGSIGSAQQITNQQLATKQATGNTASNSSITFMGAPKATLQNRRNQAAGSFTFQFHAPKK